MPYCYCCNVDVPAGQKSCKFGSPFSCHLQEEAAMSQDDQPPPRHFDDGDPAKMKPIDRHATLSQAETADLALKLDIANSHRKMMRIAVGWLLLSAAKSIEHAGTSLSGIATDEDRDELGAGLRGLYRMSLHTINSIRALYGCEPIHADLPVPTTKVEHADR